MMLNDKLSSVLKRFCAIALFCAGLLSLQAEDVMNAFGEANRLYERQSFREAAVAYEKIIDSGNVSAALYFNLGNAWFKAGEVGKAIASYRVAAKLSPRDPDIHANLAFARDSVQNARPPKSNLWTQLLDRLTVNEWSIAAASAVALTFLLLAFGQWKRDWSRTVRFYATLIGVLAAFFIMCTAASAQRHFTRSAVIAVDEAVLRRGPFDESQSGFTLRDGAELTVLDQREHWVQVADTANRVGWIRDKQVVVVR